MKFHPSRISAWRAAVLAVLVVFWGGGCDRLKKAPPPAAGGEPVPEIVDEPAPVAEPLPEIDPEVPELSINKSAQVAILGYHDFITGRSTDPMRINVETFRGHLQALKDARIPVISMRDFLAWKRGEQDIPDPSVMITIDDGYVSIHRLAMPLLKEFGYPFTVFLYRNYINAGGQPGGGRAMNLNEIRELMAAGGEIGSHSVSHPFPSDIRRIRNRNPDGVPAFQRREMVDSKRFLEDLLGIEVTTYAYPGGYNTPLEHELGREAGYEAMFTVNPAKVSWDTPMHAIPRYIVHGNDPKDRNFQLAVSFRGTTGGLAKALLSSEGDPAAEPQVTTTPAPNATIAERRPLIEVDVSKLEGIDPGSVEMKIGGFGKVVAEYDAERGIISHRIRESLRSNECSVLVTFRRAGQPRPESVTWRFFVDLTAAYLPEPVPVISEGPAGPEAAEASSPDEGGEAPPAPADPTP